MKNILFVHQSAEMYGSDKTLLLLIKNINRSLIHPVVVLPNEGPLKIELEKENIEVLIAPVIKLHRKMFTPKNMILLISQLIKGFKLLNSLHKKHNFEVIYSNTLAVLLGFFFAYKKNIKHVWHVHEIIESPKFVSKFFSFLLNRKSNHFTIYNSNATANFWLSFLDKRDNYKVISNGLETPKELISQEEIVAIRKNLFEVNNEIVIGLVGRINKWKGQFLLLESFKEVFKNNKNIKLIFVGSTTENQQFLLKEISAKIEFYEIEGNVKIIPFQTNINKVWAAIDIAVVPSIEPEPFGLVAVEAMLAKKPVIASNHGGLTEIIEHNKTGLLFEPNNVEELKNAIETLLNDKKLRLEMGNNGFIKADEEFSIEKYVSKIENILVE